MPLIVIHLPENTFSAEQKQRFAKQATDTLLALEGMSGHPKAQNLSWVQFCEFKRDDFYMAGHKVDKPHYRLDISIFQGTMAGDKKEQLTEQLTDLILQVEETDHNLLNAARVWVMINEVPDGNWGGAGKIYRIQDLMKMMR
ncbi:tautomerase family protein [Thiomicrorhabdus xiamenensis]|uniref:Tautomerase family protein n=1 Tax=Thiomicrorhabdus xiamenensis TaxID=2739063 RepID=A0A7D4TEH5_9GAMM|nr:tautomerase family protein [Thiomicrorhabdus xiamenensis]QKI89427.1 tautomerase family protein [Thiomicrorhabdus xiamenensis]